MIGYENCRSKDEVIGNFFESDKEPNDYFQASKRLSLLGYQDDALRLYIAGMQLDQTEKMSLTTNTFEDIANIQRAAATIMAQAVENLQGSASLIAQASEIISEAAQKMLCSR